MNIQITSAVSRLSITLLCSAFVAYHATSQALPSPYRPVKDGYPRFESKRAEPGVTFGAAPELPLPKTLLYAVTVDELTADADRWIEHGYEGFFLTGIAGEWSADVWAADGKPWSIGASDETLQKVKVATNHCKEKGAEVFLTSAFSHYFDWFDDVAWQRIEQQFEQMAIFARESGCAGLAIDVEYIHPQYHFSWEEYDFTKYSRKELVDTMRARMTRVAEVMYDAYPDMVLLTLPEGMMSLSSQIQTAWIEVAAKRNAPGGVHMCTEYSYRRPNLRFMLGHAWMINGHMERLLTPTAWEYWKKNGSTAEGIWVFGEDPDDFHGEAPSPEEYKQAYAAALMAGRRYCWIYSHTYRPMFLGKGDEKYVPKGPLGAYVDVVRKKEVATNPTYVAAAQAIRSGAAFDFEKVIGLTVVPTFAGPREELEMGLMPVSLYTNSPISTLRYPLWDVGLAIQRGEERNLREEFGTITSWQLVGPFDNTDNKGFDVPYPPEMELKLDAEYDTPHGKAAWRNYEAPGTRATIDLTKVFQPTEGVCAYALCYVTVPSAQKIHVRVGANDSWKLWVGGKLLTSYQDDGILFLDREILLGEIGPAKPGVL